jgi:hypothetical protein
MGKLCLSSRQVNLLSCACISTRTNPRFFAAIRCPICPQQIIFASASKTNRKGLEVHFCVPVREKEIYWMSARLVVVLLFVLARVLWFC